jgi:hypothetical protein
MFAFSLPTPEMLGEILRRMSRALVWMPPSWICSDPMTDSGIARAVSAEAMFEPVTTNFWSTSGLPWVGAEALVSAVCPCMERAAPRPRIVHAFAIDFFNEYMVCLVRLFLLEAAPIFGAVFACRYPLRLIVAFAYASAMNRRSRAVNRRNTGTSESAPDAPAAESGRTGASRGGLDAGDRRPAGARARARPSPSS